MNEELKWKFVVICYVLVTFLMAIRVRDLNKKIGDLEQRQLEINEYILNKIGG